jgi:hypothetical protein
MKEKLIQKFKQMDSNIDFKDLWSKQTVSQPDIE